jgi:hypothetical protein
MAMTAQAASRRASLKRRVRQLYESLNKRDFSRCHQMIDPRVRLKPSSVTLYQYENALREFLDCVGCVSVIAIELDLHLSEPSKLYGGRDFAVGKTTWEDRAGQQRVFSERWVREGRTWYTRSTGFIMPEAKATR